MWLQTTQKKMSSELKTSCVDSVDFMFLVNFWDANQADWPVKLRITCLVLARNLNQIQ